MLSTEMTRLCREIVRLREQRVVMLDAMAGCARERRRAVSELCRQFRSARNAMARRTRNERSAFLGTLRRTIQAQCQAVRADLAGVRKAWVGRA